MFHKEGSSSSTLTGNSNATANQGKDNKKKKTQAMDVPLGKKERKQLRQRVDTFFSRSVQQPETTPTLAQELSGLLDHVFVQDGNLMMRTLPYASGANKAWTMNLYMKTPSANTDENCWPYETSTQCVWMTLMEKKKVVCETPTVALWGAVLSRHAQLLEKADNAATLGSALSSYMIQVPAQVSKYMCRGADLMRAGIHQDVGSSILAGISNDTQTKNAAIPRDDNIMVAICIYNNPQPFAVGLLKRPQEAFGAGTKGIGVEVWNCYGDDLWKTCNTKDQISIRSQNLNFVGGAPFDNGHYGNVGFLEGAMVVPVVNVDDEPDGAEAEDKTEKEAAADASKTAWDEAGDEDPNTTNEEGQTENDNNDTNDETNATNEEDPVTVTEDEQEKEDKQEDEEVATPEELLQQAVCQALVCLNPNKDLPMPMATFYSQYVLPNRPAAMDKDIDLVKSTKYKKFGNYIKEQIQNGLLQAGKDKSNPKNTDPLALLLNYDRKHIDLRGYSKSNAANNNSTSSNKPKKLVLVNLYVIPSHWPNLLRLERDDVDASNATSEERKGTGMLTAPEVRKIFEAYILREELVPSNRPDLVQLDGPLTQILYKKEANPPTQSSRKELNKLVTSKLLPAYALVEMPGSKITVLKKGTPPKVDIEVAMRQSKKFVTRIRGLEDYGIEPNYFSKDVAKRLACASSIETDPVGRAALKKGRVEIVLQGNLVDELEALLTGDESLSSHGGVKASEYAIPKNVLEITLRKGVPARKRGGGGKKQK